MTQNNLVTTAGAPSNPFKQAERKQAWLKLALTGPSGSGKTFSALSIAVGMGKKIALIDTENKSASLYADNFEFDALEIDPPYTIKKYTDAIQAAVKVGYEVLIIDSISHAWAGAGGLLDQKEDLDARGAGGGGKRNKNTFANWASITKQHEEFKAWLIAADIHLIVTMRSKQDYLQGDGKIIKVGMAPIQREGMEYEFTTVLDLAMNHTAQASKDRTGLFDTKIFQPTIETGRALMQWLSSGKPREVAEPKAKRTVLQDRLFRTADESHWDNDRLREFMKSRYQKNSSAELTQQEIDDFCAYIEGNPAETKI